MCGSKEWLVPSILLSLERLPPLLGPCRPHVKEQPHVGTVGAWGSHNVLHLQRTSPPHGSILDGLIRSTLIHKVLKRFILLLPTHKAGTLAMVAPSSEVLHVLLLRGLQRQRTSTEHQIPISVHVIPEK